MVYYSKVERIFIVRECIRTQSYQPVRLDFAVRFLDSDSPSKSIIHYNYKKENNNSTNSTDRCCCRRGTSCRRNSLGIFGSSFHGIIKKDLR